ncbi:hypothetical protein ACLKMH_06750 [Psychromonas sp. KJ10-10]|uniref:hypothetical protein n=1 Tax=Psychromonas sp. KJ10-10 TaxID=3391823 RepID=UPI0039B66EA8
MKNIHIAFYTEAGSVRGMGHLVRSYCIAQKFKQLGFDVTFFLDSDINFDGKFDNITYFKWSTLSIINNYDIIFIDSYEANIEHYQLIAESCQKPVYIDDYKRLNYPEGTILNFSPDANNSLYKHKIENYNYLLGLEYIPIREEFLALNTTKQKQIFIMLGGTDVANLSTEIALLLQEKNIKKIIVCNNRKTTLELQKINNVSILHNPLNKELAQAMANSTIAISTASMTAYELAFLKIPTLIIAVSKNQEVGMLQLIKHNIATDFVSIEQKDWKVEFKNKVEHLLNRKHNAITNLINGNGTANIVNAILERNI